MSLSQIYDLCADTLWLGRYGENGAREVGINVAGWLADLGTDGTFMLVAWRPGEDDLPYNPNITLDGSVVVWQPSNIDTAISGRGFAELRYYVGNSLAKSKTYRTVIDPTPSEGADPPSAAEDWLERMEQAAVDATEAAGSAMAAEETAVEAKDTAVAAAQTATEKADIATTAADTATARATLATEKANVATTKAAEADADATTAAQDAARAETAAQTATSKAAEAVEAAGTATSKASEATQAATTATANAQTSTAKAGEATTAAAAAQASETAAETAADRAEAALASIPITWSYDGSGTVTMTIGGSE